jgi:predicted lipid-binding transport protein (Tim44 family)
MFQMFARRFLIATLVGAMGLAAIATDADAARRFGGGKSIGKQSDNVSKSAPPAQAAPAPSQASSGPAAAPAAAPAAPARNRWLGPLAGIAAGLGIAALLSHFGMAGAFAEAMMSFLMIGALVLAAMFAFRMWRNRNTPAAAAPGVDAAGTSFGLDTAQKSAYQPVSNFNPASAPMAAAAGGGTWTVPAGFDVDDFLHIAKMYFVRMQAAWDAADEKDIRNFTTPEVFAEVKLDLVNRGAEPSHTEVVMLDAQFLGVETQGDTTLASVRLSGMIRETADGPAASFREVWNLEKPASAKASWLIAGIQQENA